MRKEIQALRALAVASVVLYHVDSQLLPGGYVGVDIFFVISGFLITSHIARGLTHEHAFSLADFYARRMRRLLPASLLVLLVVVLITIFWLPQTLWHKTAVESMASVFYVQNWVLASDSTDYLAAAADASPVQHFWSLSVEEQFYLAWPLLLILGASFGRRSPRLRLRSMVVVVGAVALLSFAYSVYETSANTAPAYFVTTTRAWELAVGGFFALALPTMTGRAWVRGLAAWAGLALIVVSFYALSAASLFPGWVAAVPVTGAVLIIIAGDVPGLLSISRVANLRVVQFVGDISYSVYLWHWPLLVLVPLLVKGPGYQLPLKLALVVAALSLPVAWLSKRFVEDRFRHPRKRSAAPGRGMSQRWTTFAAGLTAMALVAGATSVALVVSSRRTSKAEVSLAKFIAADQPCVGAESLEAGCPSPAGTTPLADIQPDPILATQDPLTCQQRAGRTAIMSCHVGSTLTTAKRIAVVGDSHINQWMPTLTVLAERENWSITTYLKSGCPFIADLGPPSCRVWNTELAPVLRSAGFAEIITSARSGNGYSSDASNEEAAAAFVRAWQPVIDAGTRIVAIADTPELVKAQLLDPPSCVESGRSSCTISQKLAYSGGDALKLAAAATGSQIVDMTRYFCIDGQCPSVIGGVLVYRDSNHMTSLYARTLVNALGRQLASSVPVREG